MMTVLLAHCAARSKPPLPFAPPTCRAAGGRCTTWRSAPAARRWRRRAPSLRYGCGTCAGPASARSSCRCRETPSPAAAAASARCATALRGSCLRLPAGRTAACASGTCGRWGAGRRELGAAVLLALSGCLAAGAGGGPARLWPGPAAHGAGAASSRRASARLACCCCAPGVQARGRHPPDDLRPPHPIPPSAPTLCPPADLRAPQHLRRPPGLGDGHAADARRQRRRAAAADLLSGLDRALLAAGQGGRALQRGVCGPRQRRHGPAGRRRAAAVRLRRPCSRPRPCPAACSPSLLTR
jgi:hypothetical protein